MIKKKTKQVPANRRRDPFSQSLLATFGLIFEPKEINSTAGKLEFLVIKKPYGNGLVREYLIPGNEADQQCVLMAVSIFAKKIGTRHVVTFRGYRGLAKLAFDVPNPNSDHIERVKKALNNLQHRYLIFKHSFLDNVNSGKPMWSSRTVHLLDGYDYVEDEYLKIFVNPKFQKLNRQAVLSHINQTIIAKFRNDQFSRKLYTWLTSQFWGQKNSVIRFFDTFRSELAIPEESSYSQWKELNKKLPKAIQKINTLLEGCGEKYKFRVDTNKNKKITFTKHRIRKEVL